MFRVQGLFYWLVGNEGIESLHSHYVLHSLIPLTPSKFRIWVEGLGCMAQDQGHGVQGFLGAHDSK